MRARAIAISAVAHGAVIGGLLALAPRPAADPAPRARDIEVVAVPKPPPPPPPPPPLSASPARSEPMRDHAPTRVHRPSPAGTVRGPEPTQPAGDGSGSGSGDGSGSGSGDGGDGEEALVPVADRSGPPVPLDALASRTLPYTADAQRAHVSGDVVISIEVDPLGHVARATVNRGLGHGLDEIATRVALELRFRPATDRSGAPTTGRVKWRFHFQPP